MRGPFRNEKFRRLFVGRLITNVGDSLYFISAMWLVYELTDDPLYTGLAGFVTLAPEAFQFLAGPLADRWPVRRTLVGTQSAQAVVISLIPLADYLGVLSAELVLVVMPVLAGLNQLAYPAQSTALPRLLDDEDLVAANSAFSLAYQGLDMVANGVGGVLIGLVGAVTLLAVDAVTFVAAALLFATVYVPPAAESTDEQADEGPVESVEDADATAAPDGGEPEVGKLESYVEELRGGVRIIRGTFLVWLIAGTAAVNLLAGVVMAAMPVYADVLALPDALGAVGGVGAYGILMGTFAAGNFFGAIGANAVDERPFGVTMIVGYLLNGTLWMGAIAANWLPVTAVLMALAFVPVGLINVQLSAVIQSAPPNEYVGRVSSLLGSSVSAMIPVGSLAGGALTAAFTPRIAMFLLGVGTVGLGLYVLAHPGLRGLPAPDEVSIG